MRMDVLGEVDFDGNLFRYHILIYLDALARDESVHFYFIIVVLFCRSKSGVTSSPIPPLSSEIGKSDTNKNAKHVV